MTRNRGVKASETATGLRQSYSRGFFEGHSPGVRQSARKIVPIVLHLVQPKSVIDVGCGTGTWLSVLMEYGVADVLGIDGPYVEPDMLEIPAEQFLAADLRQPFKLERQFDLALCLEVAEHLPAADSPKLMESLVALSPIILFSAAIPFQGGVRHLNEQWPDYWAGLFRERGYLPIDCIRPRIWSHPDVAFYYAQNMILFGRRERVSLDTALADELSQTRPSMLSLVHPSLYLKGFEPRADTVMRLLTRTLLITGRVLRQWVRGQRRPSKKIRQP